MVDRESHKLPSGGRLDVVVQAGLRHVEVNAKGFERWTKDVPVKANQGEEVVEAKLMLSASPTPEPLRSVPPAPAPSPSGPFEVNRRAIEKGEKAELRWDIQNAKEVRIDGQNVNSSGSMTIAPTEPSTTYHLVATGPGGRYSSETVVIVNTPAPPKPTTDTASVSEQDRKAISDLLQQYAQSFEHKDAKKVQELWPGIGKDFLRKIKESYSANAKISYSNLQFSRLADGKVQVSCTQTVQFARNLHSERPNFAILVNQRAGSWVISYIPLNDQ